MSTGRWLRVWGLCALAGSIGTGFAQQMHATPYCSSGEFVRAITDAASGSRWLLLRDPEHAGGPGKLVLTAGSGDAQREQGCRSGATQRQEQGLVKALKTVIRQGDQIVVREQTSFVDLRLVGTALGPAAEGESLRVRLRIGGTVRAIAVLPGVVDLVAQREAQP